MSAPIIDRDAIIEKAAAAALEANPDDYRVASDIRAALPSIADDLLAPIEALHFPYEFTSEYFGDRWQKCRNCDHNWPCPTAKAVAAIREAVRA